MASSLLIVRWRGQLPEGLIPPALKANLPPEPQFSKHPAKVVKLPESLGSVFVKLNKPAMQQFVQHAEPLPEAFPHRRS